MTSRLFFGIAGALGLAVANPAAAIPVQFPVNGHYYEVVQPGELDWNQARAAAMLKGGYLATLTSAEENTFVWDLLASHNASLSRHSAYNRWFWLGGYQQHPAAEPADGWAWVTGEPWVYTNWNPLILSSGICATLGLGGIPAPWNNCQNPARGPADYLHFAQNLPTDPPLLWGDVELQIAIGTNRMYGYVVEYDNDPTPAPAPATVALVAAGLMAVAGRRRRSLMR